MKKLTNTELQNINGGISFGFIGAIIGFVTFILGFVDGYARPLPCRK